MTLSFQLNTIQEVPETDPSNRSQLTHNIKAYKQLQENQELKSKSIPAINIIYTNTDQFNDTLRENLFYSILYKNDYLAASDVF